MKRPKNPFLAKPTWAKPDKPIAWRVGKAAGKVGIPKLSVPAPATGEAIAAVEQPYKKDPRGRKPKDSPQQSRKKPTPATACAFIPPRAFPDSGKLSLKENNSLGDADMHWGATLDMVALAHGPVGCGVFAQTTRLNLPEFVQGIESFTALHACTALTEADIEDSGDAKLARALDEMRGLFPLARGAILIKEDPMALMDSNIKGIAKIKTKDWCKPVIPIPQGAGTAQFAAITSGLKVSAKHHISTRKNQFDVAVPFMRIATGLVWIVSKLLQDIGLNPVLEFTGSSASDMARIHQCKLIIGFAETLDVPLDHLPYSYAQLLRQWYGMPLIWTCFLGPTATDASLRAIAAHFGPRIQKRAEQVIAANRTKLDAVIARYRPKLAGKLIVVGRGLPETQLEAFHLLGMRVGNELGWPGKTGIPRRPRVVVNRQDSGTAFESYVAEAKPDVVLQFGHEYFGWLKRGQPTLPYSPFLDRSRNFLWGYDSFEPFAAALDRAVNAPWRKLLKPPWPQESG